ncbi:hypothetical protein EV175_005455 [Coemansia sp. RSA 1933]|nr:hypothetical protein EV175_005455 [Coemansia sp. RSA 1933]
MKPIAPVSQGIQSKPHDQSLFAATSSASFNNAVKAVPSQLGNAPTTVPETQNHNNLQRPQPANILQIPARATMVGPPHALQKDNRFNSAPAQSLIGGIEADRVLSVVGGILFSQLAQPTAAAADSAVTSSAVEPQQHSLASVGYYACDAGGFALPATCGPNEVCYQYGQSILCGAPGGAPRVNALLK